MKQKVKVIVRFGEIGKDDISLVGGKGANLGEMANARIPVPPGFVVTSEAYFEFLKGRLTHEISQYLQSLDVNDSKKLQEIANIIKDKISSTHMPSYMADEIKNAYHKLGDGLVAVRSSATAEDLPQASFAGQQRTFLNIQGDETVVKAVQGCWASLFEPRAIFYRHQHGFAHLNVGIAVVVQKMVQSEISGVLFTVEPLSNDETKILIEAIYGLGEYIVSGEVNPDLYLLDKDKLQIIDKKIKKQEWQLARNPSVSVGELESNIRVEVPVSQQNAQKLADKDIIALAQLGKLIENLHKSPQDIEWAKQGKELYVVQARPVTALANKVNLNTLPLSNTRAILTGIAASPGITSGPVRIITDASQIGAVRDGDVLVAKITTPDFVPAMKRAIAIVTERGGRTAHAAIVSRELGIPCVVGTDEATKILRDGQEITVDGYRGRVYSGKVIDKIKVTPSAGNREHIKTRTKVFVNLAEPDLAEVVAAKNVDGVGLLRAEFMVAQIGVHPRVMLHEGKGSQFIDSLSKGISTFTKAFHPRPVIYRTTDFKTNEYRNLRGGDKYEDIEENPMLGYRGCSRYTQEIEVLRLETKAIEKVCENYDNLWVMIPFVRFVDEMVHIKNFFAAEGLYQFPHFKLWMMVEVPSNIFLIDKFIDVGIDGISIGSNDLTQLILGIDRDNAKLAPQFDEKNEAVLKALEIAIKAATKRGVSCSICGQAPSVYPELTRKLVEFGVTSVSVSPDMINETRHIIASAEEELGKS